MGNSVMLNGIEYAGEQIAYKDSTYELVSKVAYLIGVPLRIFQNEHEPPKIEIYNRLEQTGYNLSSRNLIWDIGRVGLVVSHNSVNDGNHLPAGVAHGRHVGLPFISFFLKIKL